MRRLTVLTAMVALLATALPAGAVSERGAEKGKPPVVAGLQSVIVELVNDGGNARSLVDDVVSRYGGRRGLVYEYAISGFSAELPAAAIEELANNPHVVSITPDEVLSIATVGEDEPTGFDRIEADLVPRSSSNTDVDVAVLDTGVRLYHPDLNVVQATDCTFGISTCSGSGSLDDLHGHGTHVAGTIGALDDGLGSTGVAPGARIWSVKVLDPDGLGLLSWLIAGVDIVTAYADQIEVASMSLAGEFSNSTLDNAIANSVAAGVLYAVAAGNDGTDAVTYSPASHPDVMTVSAIADGDGKAGGLGAFACRDDQIDDQFATFSNYGSVVDIAAPGTCILSTWNDNGYNIISGTSMATPHVSGAAALYIAENGRDRDGDGDTDGDDVLAIRQALMDDGIPQGDACGFGGDPDAYPEPLLFVNGAAFSGDSTCSVATADPTGPTSPTVTATAQGYNVDLSWTGSEDPESGVLSYVVERDGVEVAEVAAHVTNYFDTDLSPATTYSYDVTPKNKQGVLGSSGTDAATTFGGDPTFAGWWALDDGSGTIAADSSGWGRDANLVNGPVWAEGMVDGALAFDGDNDRLDLDASILDGADDVTAAFWMRTTDGGSQALLGAANAGNDNEYLLFLIDPTHLRFYVGNNNSGGVEFTIPSLADGAWHHVALVRNSGPEHVYLYLDGVYYYGYYVTTGMTPLEVDALMCCQEQDSVLGGFDPNQAFNGDLDDLRLYTRVLTDNEIAELASAPPLNSDPTAVDDQANTDEDSSVVIDVLANDTDDDGDALTIDSVTQPSNGSAVINPDETVTYTPDPDFNGSDGFTYTANDGTVNSNSATVTITVNPVNDAPVAADDSYSTDEDTVLSVAAPGVLGNDSDVDGDGLTVAANTDPVNGSVTVNADGSFTYTPDPGYSGADSFTYDLTDGTLGDTATVNIDVAAVGSTVVQPAVSEATLAGSQTGDLSATQVADGAFEQLTEIHSGGRPQNRRSYLEHWWTFDIQRGDSVTVLAEAFHTPNSEGDDFRFEYSTDGGLSFHSLFDVTASGSPAGYQGALPEVTSGEVIIRVVDTDDTMGHGSTDSIFVDLLVIETENPQDPLPEVTVTASDDTASEGDPGDTGEFTLSRNDTVGDLTVFYDVSSGSATEGADYQSLSGSVTFGDGEANATVVVTPVNDDIEEGDESVALVLTPGTDYEVGMPSSALVVIVDDDVGSEFRAAGESTVYGQTTAGDYLSTHFADSDFEVLEEELHAGQKRSRLEHQWTFDITGSATAFHLRAERVGAVNETLSFAYSTDGSTWTDMSVTADGTDQTFTLPSPVAGTVFVRVTDDDNSRNEPTMDTIGIDEMHFQSTN